MTPIDGKKYINTNGQEYSVQPENSTPAVQQPKGATSTATVPIGKSNGTQTVGESAPRKTFDKNKIYEQYRKNPLGAMSHIGYNFNDKQLKELGTIISSEQDLKIFLTIAEKENLTAEDAIETYKAVKAKQKPTGFWGKVKNGVVTFFTGKTYHERHGEETSTNVSEIRAVRGEEFSTKTVVTLGIQMTQEGQKESVMHFVEVKGPKGTFRYSEQNVTDAAEFMAEKPEQANEFVKNAIELEEITNEKGEPKYDGNVIINVDKRMVNNPELASTMKTAAHKTDMTGEYLDTITANLEANPEMQESLDYSLTAKDSKGQDRFTAKSVCTQSNQLVNQDADYCTSYTENLKNIATHENINPEDAVTIANNITAHPETAADVMAKIESGNYTSSEIATYSTECAQQAEEGCYVPSNNTQAYGDNSTQNSNTTITTQDNSEQENAHSSNTSETLTRTIENQAKGINTFYGVEPLNETEVDNTSAEETVKINGKYYPKSKVEDVLRKEFGYSISDAVLNEIQNDPKFIEQLKKWGTDPLITEVLIDNPSLIISIRNTCGTISKNDLKDVLMLCNNEKNTNMVLAALENGTPANALKIARKAINCNAGDEVLAILTNNSKNCLEKQRNIDELFDIRNKNQRFESIC